MMLTLFAALLSFLATPLICRHAAAASDSSRHLLSISPLMMIFFAAMIYCLFLFISFRLRRRLLMPLFADAMLLRLLPPLL